jgi:hypothetical protein
MAARSSWPSGNRVTSVDQEAENIQFDVAYVQFSTPIGTFAAGSRADVHVRGVSGTVYGDNGEDTPNHGFFYSNRWGPWVVSAMVKKGGESFGASEKYSTYTGIGIGTDNDSNTYQITGIYRWKTGEVAGTAGWNRSHLRNYPMGADGTNSTGSYKREIPYFNIWVKDRFGKIHVANEFGIVPFGHYTRYNTPWPAGTTYQDVEADMAISNHFEVEVDLAPAKVGFSFVYSAGDDPNTPDKLEGGFRQRLDIDRAYNPCLILWNDNYMTWMGGGTSNDSQTGMLRGNAGSFGVGTWAQNVWMYQLRGGYKITPKLNLDTSFTYAYADKKPTHNNRPVSTGGREFLSKKYGSELDVTLKYKIYDNLEYMIGAGYLWTGDYFKGTDATVKLSNNYLVTHKLTLTF